MSTSRPFRAKLERALPNNSFTYVAMPFDVRQVFGSRARIPVKGTLNGYPFRTTLAPYRGVQYLPVNRALREGANVKAGDTVTIVIERDKKPRVVRTPPDLAQALKANADARAVWKKMSSTHKKEYVEAIRNAKKPETRARRVEQTIQMLVKKKK